MWNQAKSNYTNIPQTWKGCKINGKQKTQNDVKLVKRLHESEKNQLRTLIPDYQVGGMRRKALQLQKGFKMI